MSEGTTGRSEAAAEGADEGRRQEVADHLAAAVDHLVAAVKDLGDEVEKNARAEWVRAKPGLHSKVGDLQSVVDTLSARARAVLADIETRLDPPEKRDGA